MAGIEDFRRAESNDIWLAREGVREVDLWEIHDLLESGDRKEFDQAIDIVNKLIVTDKNDFLLYYFLEAAIPYHRVNRLRRRTKKALGERWTTRDWVRPWFFYACRMSTNPEAWYLDDKKLVRWVSGGYLDDMIGEMLRVVDARPDKPEFGQMVAERLTAISERILAEKKRVEKRKLKSKK